MPKYSIITVSYNSGENIERLLTCLEAQIIRDFEFILIDNASAKDMVSDKAKARCDLFVQNEVNTGFAKANNQAAKYAKGEWIVCLNPDAFPEPDWLLEIDKATNKYKDADAFGSLQICDEDDTLLDGMGDCFSIYGIAWRGGYKKPIPQYLEDGECFCPCAAAAAYRAVVFKELGGFEESFVSYYEDVDLGFRIRLNGGKCIQLSKAIVRHKGSVSSGRYSEYAVYHGRRNRILAFVRLMPSFLFYVTLPINLIATLILGIPLAFRGAGNYYRKALSDAIKMLPKAWEQRHYIQKRRKAKLVSLLRVMSFSPISLLKRAIILRKIT